MINNRIFIIIGTLLMLNTTIISAQKDTTLSREVEVIKSYKPTITPNANKINTMPSVNDKQEHKVPNFNYSIQSNPIFNTFAVSPLKAATIQTQRKKNNGYGLIRVGLGNYLKPYGEVFFNTQQSKNTIFGIHARHLSSHAKIKLNNGDKVKAPYSDSNGEMYIKHLINDKFISGNINFQHNRFHYYGFSIDSIPTSYKESENYNQHQTFTKGGANLQFGTATNDKDLFNWIIGAKYHYFRTKTETEEHLVRVDFNFNTPLSSNTFQLNSNINYVFSNLNIEYLTPDYNEKKDAWASIAPAYLLGGKIFNAKLGAKLWAHSINKEEPTLKVVPDVRINFMPIEDKFSIFAGVDGNYQINNYSKIAYNNFYIEKVHLEKATFEKLKFYGGFSAKLFPQLNLKLSADYAFIDNQNFYMNDISGSIISNRFLPTYDDIKRLTFNGELLFISSDKINIALEGNYYAYELTNLEYAYHMPNWDATLSVNYKISDRLDVASNINLIGDRKAKVHIPPISIPLSSSLIQDNINIDLKPIIDINLSGNYKITPNFSAFLQLNNLAFQRYELWVGYPSQSFNFMGGISYAF